MLSTVRSLAERRQARSTSQGFQVYLAIDRTGGPALVLYGSYINGDMLHIFSFAVCAPGVSVRKSM